jgi:hypothetical protein
MSLARLLVFLLCASVLPTISLAQTAPETASAQRRDLEAAARAAEAAQRTQEAFLLRSRLEHGDFQEGDRILVSVPGLRAGWDTAVVRQGKVLRFEGMDDFSLEGVLRFEVAERLSRHLAKYLRDSTVRAVPLLRLGVFGRVARPNYYYAAADAVLPDIIMLAGGVSADADLSKATIRRGSQTIWSSADTRVALTEGMSLDRLSLRANDDIYVPEKTRGLSWQTIVPAVSGAVALIISVIQLAR